MVVDAAFQRLRDANPVPDPTSLRRLGDDAAFAPSPTTVRSTPMQTDIEPMAAVREPSAHRKVFAIVAAAVVALATVGATIALTRPDTVVADTPVATAHRFMQAASTFDGDAALAQRSSDAVVDNVGYEAADLPMLYQAFEILDWQFVEDECTETPLVDPGTVRCTYTLENAWSRALGVEPVSGSYDFIVTDGLITRMTHNFNYPEFSPRVWEVTMAWVSQTYSSDLDLLLDTSTPPVARLRLTPEALERWEQVSREFVEAVESGNAP